MDLGPGEILLILLVIGLLFGSKRLPELARSLGRARNEFRRGLEGDEDEDRAKGPEKPSAQPDEGQGLRPGTDA